MMQFEYGDPVTVGTVASTSVLDMTNVTRFSEEVIEHCTERPGSHLLLNFEGVTYMASSALTELLRINATQARIGGTVRICGLSPSIRKIFDITNLSNLFVIHDEDTVDSARDRFARATTETADEDARVSE